MTSLIQYERARAALAEATKVDEILPLRDEVDHLKLYAKQIKDRVLLAEAHEFQLRVERKLGIVLSAAKEQGQIAEGRRPKPPGNCSDAEQFPRVTLDEVGIDRKLSSRAQKAAALPESEFEATVQATRERIIAGKAITINAEPINGARAIMGSRQEPDDSLDYFPTPPWATRALIECVFPQIGRRGDCKHRSVLEPACGEGHIAEVLAEYFREVLASDIFNYGYGAVTDYLNGEATPDADWIITNPPFNEKAEAFVIKALEQARTGVAMFLRLQWLETIGRYERIFQPFPPALIAQFAERVNLCKGRWDPEGGTATAYLWIVWLKRDGRKTEFFWIPPGRREVLSRADDVERFTAHPVTKAPRCDEPFNATTGEIADDVRLKFLPIADACCERDRRDEDQDIAPSDMPDIPAFLRRAPDERRP